MNRLLLILSIVGLAQPASSQTTILDSLTYAGQMRHVRVYIPGSRKCALIIHLHGYGSTGALEQGFTNYMPVADTAGFLVAYPDGLKDNTGNQYWNVGWASFPVTDDVGFLSALIDTLVRRYNVDANAVFASGLSNGGFMCHKLACELSNKIAAIASVSGSMTLAAYTSCAPSRAVPVMEIHGTADMSVPYVGITGAANAEDIDSVIKRCAALDQCNPVPAHNVLAHNAATTNGSNVDHYVYPGGLQGATCELYKINGGGHVEWAGVAGSFDFNASQEIWRFFRNYRVGNCAGLGAAILHPEQDIISCAPNPCTTDISLTIRKPGLKHFAVKLQNAVGQIIFSTGAEALNDSYQQQISMADFPPGIYTLEIIADGARTVRQIVKQ